MSMPELFDDKMKNEIPDMLAKNGKIQLTVEKLTQQSITRLRVARQVSYVEDLVVQRNHLLARIQDARAGLQTISDPENQELEPFITESPTYFIWSLLQKDFESPCAYNNLAVASLYLDEIACRSAQEYLECAIEQIEAGNSGMIAEAIQIVRNNRILASEICAAYQTLKELDNILADY